MAPVAYTKRSEQGDVPMSSLEEEARERFSSRLRKRLLEELEIPPRNAARWLSLATGVRWQTAQLWINGHAIPLGRNLARLGDVVGLDFKDLVGTIGGDAEPDGPGWTAFLLTPEGLSLTPDERVSLVIFHWPNPPTVADYRQLLALVRGNAERR